jgi:selenocysteine lyase/cysteine desulfurase
MFDKDPDLFPVRRSCAYAANSAIGAMYAPAAEAARAFLEAQARQGVLMAPRYAPVLDDFRTAAAAMLDVGPDDVAYVSNTAEGMCTIANGYPFEPGDQVVTYVHEFPSNHFPWAMQRSRGVELVELSDVDPVGGHAPGRPRAWSMEELADRVTDRTRIVALSHVQFASGYAADLEALAAFCRVRGIDLVIDAAQSLGALPVQPARLGIAAVVGSTWKWMLASRGAGLMYVSPDLRQRLSITVAGDATMIHRMDYLNRTWEPEPGARRYEPSTLPWEHLLTIEKVCSEIFGRYGMEAIRDEILRLQDLILTQIRSPRVRPLLFDRANRSGILSLATDRDAKALARELRAEGVIVTDQQGYIRVAPHFWLSDDEAVRIGETIERLA